MNKTSIEWCDYTWNPITGCSPASEGCENCYASDSQAVKAEINQKIIEKIRAHAAKKESGWVSRQCDRRRRFYDESDMNGWTPLPTAEEKKEG